MNKNRFLIIKGCAGIGNRLLTIKDGILYAAKNNFTIYVDWSDGWHLNEGHNSFYEYFELKDVNHVITTTPIIELYKSGVDTYPQSMSEKDINEGIYKNFKFKISKPNPYLTYIQNFLNKTLYQYLTIDSYWYRIKTSFFKPKDKFIFGNRLCHTDRKESIIFFADFGCFENLDYVFKHIKIKDFLLNKFIDFSINHNLNQAVGVHIRYTDKKPNTNIQKVISELEKLLKTDIEIIFLSTDNPKIEELFTAKFDNKIITYPKSLPELSDIKDGGIHHWVRDKKINEKRNLFEATLADMWLLSMCKKLYWQGNSSFSLISTLLKKDKENIYDWTKL